MAIRLQCSACNKTLQVADTAAGKKARCPACQALNDVPAAAPSNLSVPPKPAVPPKPDAPPSSVAKPAPASAPPASAKSSSGSPATPANSETLLVACSNCGKASRVMKSAAGKTVQCPQCKGKIVVPGAKPSPTAPTTKTTVTAKPVSSTQPNTSGQSNVPTAKPVIPTAKPTMPTAKPSVPVAKPASSSSVDIFGSVPTSSSSSNSNDIFGSVPSAPSYDAFGGMPQDSGSGWNDLGNQSGGSGGWESMGSAPANPYSSPSYGGGYGGGGYAKPVSTERSPVVYIIPGVLIALWGTLVVISACVRLVIVAAAISSIPPGTEVRWEVVIGIFVGLIIAFILGVVQILGGVALAMRNNLSMARTGAIVCTIPCFGGLCFPIGIWGLVLLCSGNYKRDFTD